MALHRGDQGEEEPRVGAAVSCDFERRIEDLEQAVRDLREKTDPSSIEDLKARLDDERSISTRLRDLLEDERQARAFESQGLGKMENTIRQQRNEIEQLRNIFKDNTLVKGIKAVRKLMDDTEGVFDVVDGIVFKTAWGDLRDDLTSFFEAERQISQAEYMAGNLRSKFSHGGYVAGKHIPPIFGKEAGK